MIGSAEIVKSEFVMMSVGLASAVIIKLDGPIKELLLFHFIDGEQILNEKVVYPTIKSLKV